MRCTNQRNIQEGCSNFQASTLSASRAATWEASWCIAPTVWYKQMRKGARTFCTINVKKAPPTSSWHSHSVGPYGSFLQILHQVNASWCPSSRWHPRRWGGTHKFSGWSSGQHPTCRMPIKLFHLDTQNLKPATTKVQCCSENLPEVDRNRRAAFLSHQTLHSTTVTTCWHADFWLALIFYHCFRDSSTGVTFGITVWYSTSTVSALSTARLRRILHIGEASFVGAKLRSWRSFFTTQAGPVGSVSSPQHVQLEAWEIGKDSGQQL